MKLESAFQSALRETVQPVLAQAGFSKKGAAFRRSDAEVVQVIAIQKSRKSTTEQIVFAVNLGVASKQLLQREEVDSASVTAEECHWRQRLSAGDPAGDSWWSVHDARSAQEAATSVAQALHDRGLPAVSILSNDLALRDLWLSGRSPGLTDVQRLLNLAVLTSRLGPAEDAQEVVQLLKQVYESNPLPAIMNYLRHVGAV